MPQILLILSTLWLSWLGMMLVHESGHVAGALCTGGTVREVVWHPTVISRTDVRPNPHPRVEVWAGPVIGCLLPLAIAAGASAARLRVAYLAWVFAGLCLIANGAYIGVGALDPVGDAAALAALGVPRWVMALFGVAGVLAGFWIWHRVSPRLGFGTEPASISRSHSYVMSVVAVLLTAAGFVFGNRGIQSATESELLAVIGV